MDEREKRKEDDPMIIDPWTGRTEKQSKPKNHNKTHSRPTTKTTDKTASV